MENQLIKETNNRWIFYVIGLVVIIFIGYNSFNFLTEIETDISINFWSEPNEFFSSSSNSIIFVLSIVSAGVGFLFMLKSLGIIKPSKRGLEDEEDDDYEEEDDEDDEDEDDVKMGFF